MMGPSFTVAADPTSIDILAAYAQDLWRGDLDSIVQATTNLCTLTNEPDSPTTAIDAAKFERLVAGVSKLLTTSHFDAYMAALPMLAVLADHNTFVKDLLLKLYDHDGNTAISTLCTLSVKAFNNSSICAHSRRTQHTAERWKLATHMALQLLTTLAIDHRATQNAIVHNKMLTALEAFLQEEDMELQTNAAIIVGTLAANRPKVQYSMQTCSIIESLCQMLAIKDH